MAGEGKGIRGEGCSGKIMPTFPQFCLGESHMIIFSPFFFFNLFVYSDLGTIAVSTFDI